MGHVTRCTSRPRQRRFLARPAVSIAALALLAGCAAAPFGPPPRPASTVESQLLLAEIAVRRAEHPAAAEAYVGAAERAGDPALCQRATEFASDYGYESLALRAARRWVGVAPGNPLAHRALARGLLVRGEVDAAATEAARALPPPEERTGDDYLALASALAESGNAPGTTRAMVRLSLGQPPSAGLSLAVAAAALGSGQGDLALAAARDAVARGGPSPGTDALIARALLAAGQREQALQMLAERGAGGDLGALLERDRILAGTDQAAEAAEDLARLAERYPRQPDVIRLRGLVALEVNDYKTAWEQFSTLVSGGREVAESLYYLGSIAERQAGWDEALQIYGRVDEGPWLVPALAAIVRILEKNGDAPSALARTEEFGRDHPRYALDVLPTRSAVLQRLGRAEDALRPLDEAIRFRPDRESLRLARSELRDQLGRTDAALADLAHAVALAPDSALALNAYGYTLANRTNRHDEALAVVRRAAELDGDNPAILDSLGWAWFHVGRLPEARSYLQLAWSRLPDPEVAAHLGEVLWAQDQRDEARALWREALERSPDSPALKALMATHGL